MRASRPAFLVPALVSFSLLGAAPVHARQAAGAVAPRVLAEPYEYGGEYTLHVPSGVLVPGDGEDVFAPASGCGNYTTNAFVNIDESLLYYTNTWGPEEWVDWGTISKDTPSDVVVQLTFGYATWVPDPSLGGPGATIELRFYRDYAAPCTSGSTSTAVEVARFLLTGLPGHTGGAYAKGYHLTLDLRGGREFVLPRGVFGFGYLNPNQEQTGIIESYAGDPKGSTTNPDGNGQVAALDEWVEDVASGMCAGPLFLNSDGVALVGSHYLLLRKYDAAPTPPATATVRNDSGHRNPSTLSAVDTPVLGMTFHMLAVASDAGAQGVFLFGYAAPLELSTPFGVLLCDPSAPGGELLAGAGLAGPHVFQSGFVVVPAAMPPDTTLCGLDLCVQAVEYGVALQLTNALDLTLGLR